MPAGTVAWLPSRLVVLLVAWWISEGRRIRIVRFVHCSAIEDEIMAGQDQIDSKTQELAATDEKNAQDL